MATSRGADTAGYGMGVGAGGAGVATSAFDAWSDGLLAVSFAFARLPEQPQATIPSASAASPIE